MAQKAVARGNEHECGRPQAVARRAAIKRWVRKRFGAPDFATLGLPAGDIIDAGLAPAAGQKRRPEPAGFASRSRLQPGRRSVPREDPGCGDASLPVARTVNDTLAHARYLALRRQVVSFANACAKARRSSEE
jgi:hypothetical protein